MSEWTCEVLSPHVDELVVLGIPPGKKGPKSDARDAFGLANQLRLGNTELAVYKGHGAFRRLCEQSRVYTGITDDVVRMKNRLKAMYRSRGIASVIVIVLVIVITGQLCPTPPTTASAGPG